MSERKQTRRYGAVPLLLLALGVLPQGPAAAAPLTVVVLDRDGNPVPDVAVYADETAGDQAPATEQRAIMDQVDTRFVPHVLVIREGTLVDFPNSDITAHHVYSFSKPNDFMLPLYKGDAHPPVRFEHEGLVTLGCNIHDQMLAYILVVNSDIFGKTDEAGRVRLDAENRQSLSINIWSPRIKARDETLTQSVELGERTELIFRLHGRLRPPHDSDTGGVQWSDY